MDFNKKITPKDIKNLSRRQRHDFMNILQVVYGYLQLDRKENAIAEIVKATNTTQYISQLHKISNLGISLVLENKLFEINNLGEYITLEVETSYEEEYRDICNEEEIINKLDEIIDSLINTNISNTEEKKADTHIKIVENSDSLQIIYLNDDYIRNLDKIEALSKKYEELKIIDQEIVIDFKYKKVKNIHIEDSIYSNLFSNTI